MYALIRMDLKMEPGKIASQAGHAFVGVLVKSDPNVITQYHSEFPESPGTKVCLKVPGLAELCRIEYECKLANIPTYKVIDSGCPNFFNGEPTVTALGIGPVIRDQIQNITGHLKLL